MRRTLSVLGSFAVGCLLGYCFDMRQTAHDISMWVLYALMFQVGIGLGANKDLKAILSSVRPSTLLLPVATVSGTLLLTALVSPLLSGWSMTDCMAVGSGFAYYSLSSVLITQLKEASAGLQVATELGAIALLANIFREMIALVAAPILSRYLGAKALISAAGVTSMDVLLPTIVSRSGSGVMPAAVVHGVLIDMSVPVLVTFFCSL